MALLDYNWLTPKAQARPAGEKGWGSYANERIASGEAVAGFGGWMVDQATLAGMSADRRSRSIQVDNDLYLVSGAVPEPGDMLNHSCEPNCGINGSAVVMAMRDIEVGEELTFDYAMTDASDYDEFTCLCNERSCRGLVTGSDWRDPVLQAKYHGFFSQYLVRRIAALTQAR